MTHQAPAAVRCGATLTETTDDILHKHSFRFVSISARSTSQRHGVALVPFLSRLEAYITRSFARAWIRIRCVRSAVSGQGRGGHRGLVVCPTMARVVIASEG
jgi:hypothetical protein